MSSRGRLAKLRSACSRFEASGLVDERTRWARDRGAELIGGPAEYDYTPGYYAVFIADPDGIKVELLHRPGFWEHARG